MLRNFPLIAILILTAALPDNSAAQTPPAASRPDDHSAGTLDSQVQTRIPSLVARQNDMAVLGQGDAMKSLKASELINVVTRGGGYLPSLAISEARRRLDWTMHDTVRQYYKQAALPANEVRFDMHSISPATAALLASTEYLAAIERSAFLPELLDRPEVWAVPSWFTATFAAMGPGWVKPVIQRANAAGPRRSPAILMTLVAAGATTENMDELRTVLQTEQSDAWLAAMQACARLNTGECWDLIAQGGQRQSEREQLRVASVQFQNGRIGVSELFRAGERAANAFRQSPDPVTRALLATELGGFLRFIQMSGHKPQQEFTEAIRATRLSTLVRQLPAQE